MEGSSDERHKIQDAFVEQDRRECKSDCIVLSGFCASPTAAKGDREEERMYLHFHMQDHHCWTYERQEGKIIIYRILVWHLIDM